MRGVWSAAPANRHYAALPAAPLLRTTRQLPRSATAAAKDAQGSPTPATQQQQDDARAQVKTRLRQLVSKVNAAVLPGPADMASLDATITELCRLNPTPDSATSDLINGRWVLLYTASMAALRQGRSSSSNGGGGSSSSSGSSSGGAGDLDGVLSPLQLANDVAYRFFYTYVPVLAGAAVGARGASSSGPVKARGNFQVFDTRAGRVENQARFEVGGRQCCVNVNGTAELAKAPPGRPQQRLRAVFTSFDLLVDGERRLSLPLALLNPVGFVDTPYLDDEIRISIGDKGSVFIASRDSSSPGPSPST